MGDHDSGDVNAPEGAFPTWPLEGAIKGARPEAEPDLARRVGVHGVLRALLGGAPAPPRVGRYVAERKVGAGGMGVVYRAHDPDTGRLVALKLLGGSGRDRGRFAREARVLRSVEHPQVVRYLDHGTTDDDVDFLVMEWLEGRDLATRLREGPLPVDDALRVALAAAHGLGAAHRAGVIHRDVKPANVFLVGPGLDDPRVVDFGIARPAEMGATPLTSTGAVLGTPHYMAPEQLRGAPEYRTDVYGLGATLFEALAGRPPFVGEHPAAVLLAVMAGEVPSLVTLRPDVPPDVDALVGRLLARDPSGRPVDMDAVMTEIAHLLGGTRKVVLSRAERAPARSVAPGGDGGAVVGRAREIGLVVGVLDAAIEEEQAARVVVEGPPGIGKSAVLDAVAAHLATTGWTVRRARCLATDTGVPFALLRQILGPAAGVLDVPTGDPLVAADRIRLAWLAEVERWSKVALCVDDAHAADLSSLRFLDAAETHLRDRAFAIVLTGPSGWTPPGAASDGSNVALGPLGERSATRLAERWAGRPDRVEAIVRLAAGNPGRLRALCRDAEADGMAVVAHDRLEALDPDDRRVLRACALVGHELWPSAVGALLGVSPADPLLHGSLARLVAAGHLVPAAGSRLRGEPQLEFASPVLHVAVRELCTEADRERGHRAMSEWLALHPVHGPAARGRHLAAIGQREEAARCFVAAARLALVGGDEALLDEYLGLADASGAGGDAHLLRAQAAFWRGRVDGALAHARDGMRAFPEGTVGWCRAASLAITASGQAGDNAAVAAIGADLAEARPTEPDGAQARIVGLYRALTQLDAVPGTSSDALRLALAEVDTARHGPEVRAWAARSLATRASSRSFDVAIDALVDAHHAHVEAGDLRSAAQMGLFLGSYHVWSGGWERARECIDDAARIARNLGAAYLVLWSRYTEGKLLSETAPPAEAADALARVAADAEGSPRIRAGARVYEALAAHRGGDPERALVAARSALTTPAVARAATAAAVRALLAAGRPDEAMAQGASLGDAASDPPIAEFDELIRLARVELASARGDADGAERALADAVARIEARAATLADPLRRNVYRARPHLVVATLRLARGPAT